MSAGFQKHLLKLEELATLRKQPDFQHCNNIDTLRPDLIETVSKHIACLAHYSAKDSNIAKNDIGRMVQLSITFEYVSGNGRSNFLSYETKDLLDKGIEIRISEWARMLREDGIAPDLPYLASLSPCIPPECNRTRERVESLLESGMQLEKRNDQEMVNVRCVREPCEYRWLIVLQTLFANESTEQSPAA